jgi:hypothetical protein
VDTKLTLERKGRDLRSFELAAGGRLKVTHGISGSSCTAQGSLGGITQTVFTEHKKGWLYITRETHKPNSATIAFVLDMKKEKLLTLDYFQGGKSHATSRVLLKPGKYALYQAQVGLTTGTTGIFTAKGSPLAAKVKLTTTLSGEFKPIKKKH